MWASVAEHFFESNYCTYYVAIMSSADITSIFFLLSFPLTLPDQGDLKKKSNVIEYLLFAIEKVQTEKRQAINTNNCWLILEMTYLQNNDLWLGALQLQIIFHL